MTMNKAEYLRWTIEGSNPDLEIDWDKTPVTKDQALQQLQDFKFPDDVGSLLLLIEKLNPQFTKEYKIK
jgi:hypothetical protein